MSRQERLQAVESLHAREEGLLARTSLFDLLASDVEWFVLGSTELLPWAGVFRGRDGVAEWMQTLDAHMEYEKFEPVEFFTDGDTVIEVVGAPCPESTIALVAGTPDPHPRSSTRARGGRRRRRSSSQRMRGQAVSPSSRS